MKKVNILFCLFCLISTYTIANPVDAYIAEHKLNNNVGEWCWAIEQDNNDFMIFGTSNGVSVYDGVIQNNIELPSSPNELLFDSISGNIWVCGYGYTGLLKPFEIGNYSFEITDTLSSRDYASIRSTQSNVFISSDNFIVGLNRNTGEKLFEIESESLVEHAFVIKDEIYFIIDYFLYTINDGKLKEVANVDLPVEVFTYNIQTFSGDIILGTETNVYYLFDGKKVKRHFIKGKDFFKNNIVNQAKQYNKDRIILGSLAGGIAVVDLNADTVMSQIDYYNGLSDDEIRSIYVGSDKGIWVSHNYGINRIDLDKGIEEYSNYPGLKGKFICVKQYNNELYVGTSEGVFKLSEKNDYDEYTVAVKVVDKAKSKKSEEVVEPQEEGRNRLFKFRKKQKNVVSYKKPKNETSYKIARLKKRKLISVSHEYMAIQNVNDWINGLTVFEGKLLILGNSGLYVFDSLRVTQKIRNAKINSVNIDTVNSIVYCITNDGLFSLTIKDGETDVNHFMKTSGLLINTMCIEENNIVVLGYNNTLVRYKIDGRKYNKIQGTRLPKAAGNVFFVQRNSGKTVAFAGNSRYAFAENGELIKEHEYPNNSKVIRGESENIWVNNTKTWELFSINEKVSDEALIQLNLFDNISNVNIENGSIWVVTNDNDIYKLNSDKFFDQSEQRISIISKTNSEGNKIKDKNIEFEAYDSYMKCKLSAPFYIKPSGVLFRYSIEGVNKEWSDWSKLNEFEIKYLPPGKYKLRLMAKNYLGEESGVEEIKFSIAKPFTQTTQFYVIAVLAMILLSYIIFRMYTAKLRKNNEILEQRVKERTQTIEKQKHEIEKQHDDITQSIQYAERIQSAMLPNSEIIEAVIPKHFILFKPRDIVSGDFYFFKHIGENVVFIAADSTGHGVPGGFMSMLGMSFLREITSQLKTPTTAADILNHLRAKIKLTLGQTDENSPQKDGMDMSVCLINPYKKIIQFAGAYNPLILIRNGELEVIKADRQPVAVYSKRRTLQMK